MTSPYPRPQAHPPLFLAHQATERFQAGADDYPTVRRALLRLAPLTAQRSTDDYRRLINLMVTVRRLHAARQARLTRLSLRAKADPQGTDPLTRWYAAVLSERLDDPAAPVRPPPLLRPQALLALDTRDLERHSANALAQALWAVHQGERQWQGIPTKPSISQAQAPGEKVTASLPQPERLEVSVPESAYGPALTLHLYRSDYERLLRDWGYFRTARTQRLRAELAGSGNARALDELTGLALEGAGRPNLAQAWCSYVEGPRLGDIFRAHVSGSMQLCPGRTGDLREAALAVLAMCRVHRGRG